MRASWSLALKSAAVSEAKTVGSKAGGSPTVATSCPVRSTMSAVRAFDSRRKPASTVSIFRESSSRNDQLDAPPLTEPPLPSARRSQLRLEPADDRPRTPPQYRVGLPLQIVAQQPYALDAALAGEKSQGPEPPHDRLAEQIVPAAVEAALGEEPADQDSRQRPAARYRAPRSHQGSSCRAVSACASVTPSTYSRSPPTGNPRASRVTRTGSPARSCCTYVAVTSPSMEGLVARITSRT